MINKNSVWFFIIILLLAIGVVLLFGYLGDQEVKKIGAYCNIGLHDMFCWKWTKMTIIQP